MTKNILEKRIEEKAQERFDKEFLNAIKLLSSNDILKRLVITENNTKLKLVSNYGVCYATDLFNTSQIDLLKRTTNYNDIEKEVIEAYIKQETDNILNNLFILENYLNEYKEN